MVNYGFEKDQRVGIVVGSRSDLKSIRSSGMLEILKKVEVEYYLSIVSAHRNTQELIDFCEAAMDHGISVFIGIAGMAAALPGAIAGATRKAPVIGVALTSTDFSNGLDSLLTITRMPPGVPVMCTGIGDAGLKNAAIAACQILSLTDKKIMNQFENYVLESAKDKPALFGVLDSFVKNAN